MDSLISGKLDGLGEVAKVELEKSLFYGVPMVEMSALQLLGVVNHLRKDLLRTQDNLRSAQLHDSSFLKFRRL